MIADDRRRSQKIEHGSIFCDRLRSSAITIAGSQAIAEVCFHMIADDRRTFCDLRSAIVCDHMETSLYREARNKAVSALRSAKREFYKDAFGENRNNPKATWNTIKTLTGSGNMNKGISKLQLDGKAFENATEIVFFLNR